MSFHFSYLFRISFGIEATCLSTRRCSSMRHMLYNIYTIFNMSRQFYRSSEKTISYSCNPWNRFIIPDCRPRSRPRAAIRGVIRGAFREILSGLSGSPSLRIWFDEAAFQAEPKRIFFEKSSRFLPLLFGINLYASSPHPSDGIKRVSSTGGFHSL
jgi:hypothetical protein